MKILSTNFQKRGFQFEQLMRQDDVALFRKTRVLDGGQLSQQNISYELIRVRKYADREIGGVLIPATEAFPPSEAWGRDGGDGCTILDQGAAVDLMIEWLKERPTTTVVGEPTGKNRGRTKIEFDFEVPKDTPFMLKDLYPKYPNVSPAVVAIRLNELRQNGTVKVVGTQRSDTGRGKPSNIFQFVVDGN